LVNQEGAVRKGLWTDQAQVSLEHVEELGLFVDAEFSRILPMNV
jgi:hypothetical protein